MTVRLFVLRAEDQTRGRIPLATFLEQVEERVRDGDRALFVILWFESLVELLLDREGLRTPVNILPCRILRLLLASARREQELE